MTISGYTCSQPIEAYAWQGFNFLLICVGILALVGGACLAYNVYKSWNPKNN